MTKPVDLIIVNALHHIASKAERKPVEAKDLATTPRGQEVLARSLLCELAHEARVEVILKLLETAGVQGGLTAIGQRLTAVLEARAEEARALGIEPPKAVEIEVRPVAFFDALRRALEEAANGGAGARGPAAGEQPATASANGAEPESGTPETASAATVN